eukprot:196920-Pyramimonas_sp.AAC.1
MPLSAGFAGGARNWQFNCAREVSTRRKHEGLRGVGGGVRKSNCSIFKVGGGADRAGSREGEKASG